MKFYVFPRKWNDIYFSISMKDSSSKSSLKYKKLNRKHKKSIRSRWTYKYVSLLFIQRTLKLLKDNFSSLTTKKKPLISKWADGNRVGRGNREYRVRLAIVTYLEALWKYSSSSMKNSLVGSVMTKVHVPLRVLGTFKRVNWRLYVHLSSQVLPPQHYWFYYCRDEIFLSPSVVVGSHWAIVAPSKID